MYFLNFEPKSLNIFELLNNTILVVFRHHFGKLFVHGVLHCVAVFNVIMFRTNNLTTKTYGQYCSKQWYISEHVHT